MQKRNFDPAAALDQKVDGIEEPRDLRKILVVAGDQINRSDGGGDQFLTQLFGEASGLVQEIVGGAIADLSHAIVDADVVHFSCHGRSNPMYHLSLGPNAGRQLYIGGVRALHLKPGATVFVHACGSAASSLLLAEFESLGFEFYRIGARPFIGTLAPVPERHANKLASRYYHWLIDQRMTAIQALRNAKADVAADGGIPFWLFYCYYGTADQAPYRLH